MSKYRIAVDLGATKILVGIIDEANVVIDRKQVLTEKQHGSEYSINNIVELVRTILAENSIDKHYCSLGLCAPGPINIETGSMINSVNFDWGIVHLKDILTERLGMEVLVEHDAKAGALGAFHYGAGKEYSDMVYIVIGSGVGGAIIINNVLYRGLHNFAGEIGHISIDYKGDRGANIIRGNTQSFMAGPSLAYHYCKMLKQSGQKIPKQEVDGRFVGDLAQQGDEIALKVIEQAGIALGVLVGSLAMILDIDLYVVGSSVAKLGDLLLEIARKEVYNYAFKDVADNVKIVANKLGDDTALLGCAHFTKYGLN